MVDILQTKKKNILIIGYGSMGRKYEAILKKDYSVFFFDKKNFKKKNFIKKLDYTIIKKFYFVVIATPPKYHKKYCEICVKANRDLIVEKPLFLNKKGWQKIILNIKKKKIDMQCSLS